MSIFQTRNQKIFAARVESFFFSCSMLAFFVVIRRLDCSRLHRVYYYADVTISVRVYAV